MKIKKYQKKLQQGGLKIVEKETYFKEVEESEWSLISFLRWKSRHSNFFNKDFEHGTWKNLIEAIAISDICGESAKKKAQNLIFSFKVRFFLIIMI